MPEHRRPDPSIEGSGLNVETWPLERALELTPAWGGDTWDQVIDSALADADDLATIEHLVDALTTENRFREPIRVDTCDDGERRVGNGMHRIISHVVTGHDQVLVTHDGAPLVHAWQAIIMLTTQQVEVAEGVWPFVSMPLNADTWVETFGAGRCGNELSFALTANRDIHAAQLRGVVADWLTQRGIAVPADSVVVTPYDPG